MHPHSTTLQDEFITLDLIQRFYAKVETTADCWLWTGARVGRGYGGFGVHGRMYLAHRVAWIFAHGAIPAGLFVCHNCPGGDNPRCVRVDHLFLGTHDENMADQWRKGRKPHGERHWKAKLTDEDVRDIRRKSAAGLPGTVLAAQYSVDKTTIWEIVHGRHWRHIDADPAWAPHGATVGYARGERHGRAKLTSEQVQAIRARYTAGGVSQQALAAEYGVSQKLISLIVRRKKWEHLD